MNIYAQFASIFLATSGGDSYQVRHNIAWVSAAVPGSDVPAWCMGIPNHLLMRPRSIPL